MQAKFGPAGNSESFAAQGYKSTLQAPGWLEQMGLDAYEYQCGRGVNVSDKTARDIGEKAAGHSISMSIHAPYFISLGNPERLEQNAKYILQSCQAAVCMGATRVVIHSGALLGRTREQALEISKNSIAQVWRQCLEHGYQDIALCPELMGVISQLGDLDEVIQLCLVDDSFIPCIDFGHLNSRTGGGVKTIEDALAVFERIENSLGRERAAHCHIHFSKIMYSDKGEVKHLTLADTEYGPEFEPVAQAIVKMNLAPTIICESAGTQAEDSVKMKRIYQELLSKK